MTVAVGVDLGGTNVRAALVDVGAGRILGAEGKRPVADKRPEAVAALVEELVRSVDAGGERAGVGVGFAGMLRGWTGVVVNAPNFGWREVDFRSLLRARVGERTELYNDLNAIAFGEASYGGARGVPDVLCIYIGTGVGAGLVTDGRLYIGATHLAGELGHVKVVLPSPAARLCGCGQRGCLEAYVSGVNLQARVREELGTGSARSLAVELAGGLERVHPGHLDEAARAGDPYADGLWREVSALVGVALANAVTVLNPSRLVLGGGVWQGAPELRRRALAVFEMALNRPALEGFAIVDTTLGDSAGVLGAAALIATKGSHG
jgi:glucokinase